MASRRFVMFPVPEWITLTCIHFYSDVLNASFGATATWWVVLIQRSIRKVGRWGRWSLVRCRKRRCYTFMNGEFESKVELLE